MKKISQQTASDGFRLSESPAVNGSIQNECKYCYQQSVKSV